MERTSDVVEDVILMETETDEIPSTAAVFGHPIHPMLIPFPITLLSTTLFSDISFLLTRDPFWAKLSKWTLRTGLLTGVVAALPGMIDFTTKPRIRMHSKAWVHMVGNVAALLLSYNNLRSRRTVGLLRQHPTVNPQASAVVGLMLVVTGFLGGELSYRHKIGVNSHGEESPY